MTVRARANRAAYLVLADELRDAIRRQDYSAEGQLPTETSLATEHRLSRQTVRRAYLELVAEGLVDRIPGRGTFVTERGPKYLRQFGSVEDLMSLAIDTTIEIVRPLARRVDIEAAARLRLDTHVVHSVSYVRSHHGIVIGWTTVSVPPSVAALIEGAPELTVLGASNPLTVIGLLEGQLHDPIAEAQQMISAVAADDRAVDLLGCSLKEPILRIDRLFLSTRGEPLELSIGYFLPEQYTYSTILRRSAP